LFRLNTRWTSSARFPIQSNRERSGLLDCLRACMRLKPTRIAVGEEAHVMLKIWNTGHPARIATVHANDAIGGLVRLESLVGQ